MSPPVTPVAFALLPGRTILAERPGAEMPDARWRVHLGDRFYDPELNGSIGAPGNPGPDMNGDIRPGDNLTLQHAGARRQYGKAAMALSIHAA
jgi:hypothetical protein